MVKAPFFRKKGSLALRQVPSHEGKSKNLDSKRCAFNYMLARDSVKRRFIAPSSPCGPDNLCVRASGYTNTRGQMKIMQMAFMIVAVFFFFVLVGLFFLSIQFKDVKESAAQLQREQAISSLRVIADMPELSYDSSEAVTLDEDKLRIMASNFSRYYDEFWPVASVSVYKLWPVASKLKRCPGLGCNYYKLFDNGQDNVKTYSTYVSICKKVKESGFVYDRCEVGKLEVGTRSLTEEAGDR